MTHDASMSRKRASRSRETPQKPRERRPRAAARGRGATRGIAVATIVVVAAAAAWIAFGRRVPGTAPAAGTDPAAHLEPRVALEAGIRLGAAGQSARSVPYFRRAVAGLPGYWQARYDLSSALANAAVESHVRLGRLDPALRSSAERIGAIVESEREMDAALAHANGPHDRAVLLVARSQTYLAWGMPVDALSLLQKAQAADPAWEEPARLAGQVAQGLSLGGMER